MSEQDSLTNAQANKMLQNVIKATKETMRRFPVRGIPMLIVYMCMSEDGEIMTESAKIDDIDHCHQELYKLGKSLAKKALVPIGIWCAAEAWYVREENDKGQDVGRILNRIRPSEHPNRQECIVFSGKIVDGRAAAISYEIKRDRRDMMVMGGELARHEFGAEKENSELRETLLNEFFHGAADNWQTWPDDLQDA